MKESVIEAHLREQIRALGGKAYKFISPGNAGVPDRIVILPGGRVIFTELKAPGGKLTVKQDAQIRRIEQLGCNVRVLHSKAEVDQFIAYCKELMSE